MKKYGIENFYIELVEDNISDEDINEKEIFYIKQYNSYIDFENSNGYNATLGGDGKKYKNWNLDELIRLYNEGKNCQEIANIVNLDRTYVGKILRENGFKIKSAAEIGLEKTGKKIYQLDINTYEIINIYPSQGEANIALGKNRKNGAIGDALRARRGHHKAYGYLWFHEEDYQNFINK